MSRLRAAARALRAARGALGSSRRGEAVDDAGQSIVLDHPVRPVSRWGYGRPPHPELDQVIRAGRARYEERLRSLLAFTDELAAIPFDGTGRDPSWTNGWFQGLDAASLYGFLAQRNPATYLEGGAGNSTRFARRAIERHDLSTKIVSIDPRPRAALAGLADEHLASPLEDVELDVFARLGPGDVLLVDGSHRAFTNSDVTVFFTEVLPRLPAGLLVCVDDVFLPWDYPPQMSGEWYSEQYLLAAWLLAGERIQVTLPSFWVSTEPDLHRILAPLWDQFTWAAIPTNGTGFWMTVR
jgi:hypothetical protein